MHVTGTIAEPQFTASGRLRIVLEVNEKQKALDEMNKLFGQDLEIDVHKYRKHRSKDANAYFWKLVDEMSKVLGSDKDTIYLLQLSKYGVFSDLVIKDFALPTLQTHFRFTEILEEEPAGNFNWLTVRCFFGSSKYNTKEMSDLINGTVQDCNDLGIETLTEAEIGRLIEAMKENTYV